MYLNMCTQCSLQFQCISLRPSIPVWAIWGAAAGSVKVVAIGRAKDMAWNKLLWLLPVT